MTKRKCSSAWIQSGSTCCPGGNGRRSKRFLNRRFSSESILHATEQTSPSTARSHLFSGHPLQTRSVARSRRASQKPAVAAETSHLRHRRSRRHRRALFAFPSRTRRHRQNRRRGGRRKGASAQPERFNPPIAIRARAEAAKLKVSGILAFPPYYPRPR